MAYPAPFVGRIQKVEDQWTDYNGHFNMAYYNVLFDRAGDEAFAAVGLGPDYVKDAQRLVLHAGKPQHLCARTPCRRFGADRDAVSRP